MGRNVEIKARATGFAAQRAKAGELAGGPPELLEQEDTFFRTKRGRLKLRRFDERRGELIYYERPDGEAPEESHYLIIPTREPDALKRALSAALGVRGTVTKRRELFMVGSTRIHMDEVNGLGEFIELEAVLGPGESGAEGSARVDQLVSALGIGPSDLIDKAYIDLLMKKQPREEP